MLINLLHFFSCRQHIFICLLKDAVPGYLILFRFSAGHYIILCRSLDFKDKQDFSTGYQAFCFRRHGIQVSMIEFQFKDYQGWKR